MGIRKGRFVGFTYVVARVLISGEHNVVSLSNVDKKPVRSVISYWHKIGFDNGQFVVVKRNRKAVVHGRVNETQAVRRIGLQRSIKVMPSIGGRILHGSVECCSK